MEISLKQIFELVKEKSKHLLSVAVCCFAMTFFFPNLKLYLHALSVVCLCIVTVNILWEIIPLLNKQYKRSQRKKDALKKLNSLDNLEKEFLLPYIKKQIKYSDILIDNACIYRFFDLGILILPPHQISLNERVNIEMSNWVYEYLNSNKNLLNWS